MLSSMLPINKAIKRKREALGISESEMSQRAGLSIHEYGDLEAYPDEFYQQISMEKAKEICKILGIEIRNFLPGCSAKNMDKQEGILRNNVVAQERKKSGLTREQLADQIGYETIAIEKLEAEIDYLDTMCLAAILDIAKALKIDPCLLL